MGMPGAGAEGNPVARAHDPADDDRPDQPHPPGGPDTPPEPGAPPEPGTLSGTSAPDAPPPGPKPPAPGPATRRPGPAPDREEPGPDNAPDSAVAKAVHDGRAASGGKGGTVSRRPSGAHATGDPAGDHADEVAGDEPLLAARVHRPADLLRLLLGILGLAVVLAIAGFAHGTTSGVEQDIARGTNNAPDFLISFAGFTASVAVLIVPVAFAVERLIKRDGLRVADGVLAAVLAHGVSLAGDLWVDQRGARHHPRGAHPDRADRRHHRPGARLSGAGHRLYDRGRHGPASALARGAVVCAAAGLLRGAGRRLHHAVLDHRDGADRLDGGVRHGLHGRFAQRAADRADAAGRAAPGRVRAGHRAAFRRRAGGRGRRAGPQVSRHTGGRSTAGRHRRGPGTAGAGLLLPGLAPPAHCAVSPSAAASSRCARRSNRRRCSRTPPSPPARTPPS